METKISFVKKGDKDLYLEKANKILCRPQAKYSTTYSSRVVLSKSLIFRINGDNLSTILSMFSAGDSGTNVTITHAWYLPIPECYKWDQLIGPSMLYGPIAISLDLNVSSSTAGSSITLKNIKLGQGGEQQMYDFVIQDVAKSASPNTTLYSQYRYGAAVDFQGTRQLVMSVCCFVTAQNKLAVGVRWLVYTTKQGQEPYQETYLVPTEAQAGMIPRPSSSNSALINIVDSLSPQKEITDLYAYIDPMTKNVKITAQGELFHTFYDLNDGYNILSGDQGFFSGNGLNSRLFNNTNPGNWVWTGASDWVTEIMNGSASSYLSCQKYQK